MASARKIGIFIFFFLGMAVSLLSQKTYSEKEINRERMFLDAYQKKILGKFEEAIELYKNVYDDAPDGHAAAYELARIYHEKEDLTEAIRWMKLAQTGDPDNIYYQEYLAALYQSGGRFLEAADVYKSLAQKDRSDYFYYRWAYFLVKGNEIDEAIKAYDELEKIIGINEETIRRKHTLYLGRGDHKRAARELEKLIDAFPNNVDYRHLLAAFYEQIGERKDARAAYEQILSIDPGNAEAQMALAGKSAGSNNELQYLTTLRPAFEQSDVALDLKIGKLLPFIQKVADTGDRALADGALALVSILEGAHADDPKVYATAGDLYFYSGRLPEARGKYEKTLELDESVYPVWEQLCMTHLLDGDFSSLSEVSNDGIDLFPNKAKLYYFHGLAALELGRFEDAQDMLDQALLMSSRDALLKEQILSALGEAYTALGDFDGADRVFAEAMELNGQSSEILARYSLSLSAREGAGQHATKLADQALKGAPEYPLALLAHGMAFYKSKDFAKAKAAMQKALDRTQERSPRLLEHFGDVLYQLGEMDQAVIYWQKARDQGRNTKALDKKINDRKI